MFAGDESRKLILMEATSNYEGEASVNFTEISEITDFINKFKGHFGMMPVVKLLLEDRCFQQELNGLGWKNVAQVKEKKSIMERQKKALIRKAKKEEKDKLKKIAEAKKVLEEAGEL